MKKRERERESVREREGGRERRSESVKVRQAVEEFVRRQKDRCAQKCVCFSDFSFF